MKQKTCARLGCGIEYTPTGGRQKYCQKCGAIVAMEHRIKSAKKWAATKGKAYRQEKCALYRKSQSVVGYIQRTYVVHVDDADKLQEFAKKLRRARRTKPE